MDFALDYMSVNALWSLLLTIHMLLAVALLGAIPRGYVAAG